MTTTSKVRAFVAIGSNLADPKNQVQSAFTALDALPGTHVVARSALYRTAPVGYANQPDFFNAVAEVETELSASELLDALLALEQARGRVREIANGPRTLDLDVLLYDDTVSEDVRLTLPHPRMHERAFVLYPLNDIAPDVLIPGHGRVHDLMLACDSGGIERAD